MEQILNKKMAQAYPFGRDASYHAHMLPVTDDLLDRSFNISIGVVDAGLGAAIGINILSPDEEIDGKIAEIRKLLEEC